MGKTAKRAIEAARQMVADFIGTKPDRIVFTSGASESNNLAIRGMLNHLITFERAAITSATEHDSILNALGSIVGHAIPIYTIPTLDNGSINVKALEERLIEDAVGLVCVMHTNNETGTQNDIQAVSELCAQHKAWLHCDYTQAAGSVKIDVNNPRVDSASISSHKIYGPKGVGALYLRDFKQHDPIIYGGESQEWGMRGGTENVAGIVGFGEACNLASDMLRSDIKHYEKLSRHFNVELSLGMGGSDLYLPLEDYGIHTRVDSHKILNLRIEGISGEALVMMMDSMGVCISAGSACRSHESEPNSTLIAMGYTEAEARSAVRVSFGRYNTEEEVYVAASKMAECIKTLRRMPRG